MKRRRFIAAAAVAATAAGCTASKPAAAQGRSFLVAHGAWSAGWSWKKMHPLMQSSGHRLFVPTQIDASHSSQITAPEALATLLDTITAQLASHPYYG